MGGYVTIRDDARPAYYEALSIYYLAVVVLAGLQLIQCWSGINWQLSMALALNMTGDELLLIIAGHLFNSPQSEVK